MPTSLLSALAVFFGAGVGGLLRYSVVNGVARHLGLFFPYGTLAVNLVGGFALGLLVGLWSLHDATPTTRLFLITGLLGGFTTFSAFTLETVTLIERQQTMLAMAYIAASVCGAILALVAGMALGRHLAA